jgi:hypothetical protein
MPGERFAVARDREVEAHKPWRNLIAELHLNLRRLPVYILPIIPASIAFLELPLLC